MKKIILFIILIGLGMLSGHSQVGPAGRVEIGYTYDDAGNRTSRILLFIKSEIEEENNLPPEITTSTELEAGLHSNSDIIPATLGDDIKIYPNPTTGLLHINVNTGLDNPVLMKIYDSQGKMVTKRSLRGGQTTANLHKCPDGMYILKLSYGDNSKQWKILKQQ